jgi:UDP-N-acetylglucosamine 2-epimerase
MYESHFGFTGSPFSLNPDPHFFFGSKGHSNALSYLKFGVYQSEGFVVVTGEIGAGKTTLVGTLLSEVDRERIVPAQIVSTQLEAGDLLRSVALAFGIAPKTLSKAELIATIEAYLTLLVTEDKRALLIVDEAQNLNREAVEELRMLSNFQLGNQALLQSFLVGQPELRQLLTSKPMEQFRQRVIASCHLGPMDRAETKGYIEHRLKQVGWHDTPHIDEAAFDGIHRWTAGIPRRVNLMCNRLLLQAYLSTQSRIDAAAVDVVGQEIRVETGESPPLQALDAAADTLAEHEAATIPAMPAQPAPVAPAPARPATPRVIAPPRPPGPIVCVAGSAVDDIKMAVLLRALKQRGRVPSALRVRIGDPARYAQNDGFCEQLGVAGAVVPLHASETSAAGLMAEVLKQFATIVDEHRPSLVIVAGAGDSALACALAGRKKRCRIVHVDAGWRGDASHGDALNSLLIDRIAELYYPADTPAWLNLVREGVAEANVLHAGSLLADATHAAASHAMSAQAVLQNVTEPWARLEEPGKAYGLALLDDAILHGDRDAVAGVLSRLHEAVHDMPLVWPMSRLVEERLQVLGLSDQAAHERLSIIDPVAYVEGVSLMRDAAFVVSDSRDVQLQSAVLGVRCLLLDPARHTVTTHAAEPAADGARPGDAAKRIAEHLGGWLAAAAAH